jgi:UrcA family protein
MKTAMHCTLLVVLICSLNGVAGAGEANAEPPKRVVKFADLDLTRTTGAAALYARLRSAARLVCEPTGERSLQSIVLMRRCVEQSIERAVAAVNAPALTDYYLAKTGQIVAVAQRR